ncbi:MAG: TolC family protein, partial [Gammaproteobacteria bacterium]|nr:TolC family protein [Gammaproteobacteria bacterium]
MAETRKTPNRRRGTRAAFVVAGTTAVAVAIAALAGCATYKPLPLPPGDDLAATVAHPPLDMDAVATLAVLRNPDLAAARARLHVAAAQAFAAGILPDPQFNASTDHPTDKVTSKNDPRYPEFNAYGFGLGIDLRALLTYRSTRAAADAALRQARAELLWREWQTVAQARMLYAAQSINAQRRAALAPATALYAATATQSERALAQG